MHEFLGFNGKIQIASGANISAVSSAALYGRGIFTTVAIYNGKPFLRREHWRRLTENAAQIELDLTEFSEEEVFNNLDEIIGANKIKTGRARISFFDCTGGDIWKSETARKTDILMMTVEPRELPESGLRLTISPYKINQTSPLAGVKSCNYLENLLALDEAKTRGFNEALRENFDGDLVSAALANVFWVKNKIVFTPPLASGALAGTMRGFVMEAARKMNLKVEEFHLPLAEIKTADEIFLTSAGLGICAAQSLDETILQNDLTLKLQQKFIETVNQ